MKYNGFYFCRILGANRNHALGATQVVAHAAHVHADHLARVVRHKGTAVAEIGRAHV